MSGISLSREQKLARPPDVKKSGRSLSIDKKLARPPGFEDEQRLKQNPDSV